MDKLYPEGALVVMPVDENQWSFEYPRLSWEMLEAFHDAIELWRAGHIAEAEAEFVRLVTAFPEFIDARHHLALLLSETGRGEEAYQAWHRAVEVGLSGLPETFEMGRDQLPWVMVENRPFLRACHGLGLKYLERGQVEQALDVFEDMLALNPGDNQGVRALVIDCYFQLGDPEGVLEICELYPDDAMEQVLYGRVLALYQLGFKAEAKEALDEAIKWLPLVGKELAKKRHQHPKGRRADFVVYGGAEQAYFYWKDQGQYWKDTPGAIEWVRACLQKRSD